MSRRLVRLGILALIVLAAATGLVLLRPAPRQAETGLGGPFVLETGEAKPFNASQLAGKPYIIFFGYTHCPDVCPATLTELASDIKILGKDADKMNYVFVTIDPARDTPAVMQAYVRSFDPRIIGLTGTAAQIATIAREWHVFYRKQPGSGKDYTMEHSATAYLMDARGSFAGFFNFQDKPAAQMAKIRAVLAGHSALDGG
ncbi:MAG: SCO family protein [Hyphomicrobiales bacterium]|nr:SCO family protein [Hyphomicrobiales bacterium]